MGTLKKPICVSPRMSRSLWMLPLGIAVGCNMGCTDRPVVTASAPPLSTAELAVLPSPDEDGTYAPKGGFQPTAGTLVALNKKENTASIIHLGTGKTLAKVPTGPNPNEVAISPDGKTAVISDMGHGAQQPGTTLTLIDIERIKVLGKIELGEYGAAHGVLWLDANRVLFTSHMKNALGIVDVSAKKILKTIETGERGTHLAVVSPDKRIAYAANATTGTLTVADLGAGKVLKTIPCGARAEGVAISPDGKTVTVGNVGANTVDIIDTGKLERIRTLEGLAGPIRTAFSPDGRTMIVSAAGSGQLIAFDTGNWERRADLELAKSHPDFESFAEVIPMNHAINGHSGQMYFVAVNANAVAVVDPKTLTLRGRIPTGELPDGIAWSPITLPDPKQSMGARNNTGKPTGAKPMPAPVRMRAVPLTVSPALE